MRMFKTAFISVALLALPILGWAQTSTIVISGERFPMPVESENDNSKTYVYSIPEQPSINTTYVWFVEPSHGVLTQNLNMATVKWKKSDNAPFYPSKINVTVTRQVSSSTFATMPLCSLSVVVSSYSSHFSYAYDANGARIMRTPIEVSSIKSSLMSAEEIAELEALLREQEGVRPGMFGTDSLSGPSVRIYPNPTQAMFSFDFSEVAGRDSICAGLALTTMQGASISPASCGEGTAVYDLSSYPAGSYLLQLSSGAQAGSWLVTKY